MVNVPQKYVPKNLSKKDKKKQRAQLLKSRKNYNKGKYYTRKKVSSFKSKESPHIKKARKMYKVNNIKPTRKLARKTKCSIKGLRRMVQKGQGAYYSSGSRPNQTGHSWGYARMASAITGGKASAVDFHILKEECKKDSKALRLAKKAMKKYKKGTRRVKKIKIGGGWSKKYKKSINCKKPKGFSQKQYCKYGRKKKKKKKKLTRKKKGGGYNNYGEWVDDDDDYDEPTIRQVPRGRYEQRGREKPSTERRDELWPLWTGNPDDRAWTDGKKGYKSIFKDSPGVKYFNEIEDGTPKLIVSSCTNLSPPPGNQSDTLQGILGDSDIMNIRHNQQVCMKAEQSNSGPCNYYILKPQIHHRKLKHASKQQKSIGKETVLDKKGSPIVHTMCLPQNQVDKLLNKEYRKGAKQSGTRNKNRKKDFFITKEDYERMAGTSVDKDYSKFKVCPYRTNDEGQLDLNGPYDIGGAGRGQWLEYCE